MPSTPAPVATDEALDVVIGDLEKDIPASEDPMYVTCEKVYCV